MTSPTRCGLCIALVLMLTLIWCSTANAGTYAIHNCNVPDRGPAPSSPWFWEFAANASAADDCSKGGGFGFYFGGPLVMPRGADAALTLTAPAPITIRRVRLWMAARLEGTGSALFVGTNAGTAYGQVTNSGVFSPPGGDNLASPFVTPLLPLGTNVFRVLLYCSESSSLDCYPSSRSTLEVLGAETTLLESVPPLASITGGTLLSGDIQSGTRTVQYTVQDDQSGVQIVEVLLDDGVVLRRDLAAQCPYTDPAACQKRRVEELPIDTSSFANGSHRLRVRATDAAGNVGESEPTRVINVRNVRDSVDAPTDRGRVTAEFVGTARRTLRVDYTRRVKVRGTITTASGQPVAKAAIGLVETVAGHEPSVTRQVAHTGNDGRFVFQLADRGRSRAVRVQYLAPGSDEPVVSPILKLKVRATALLKVSLRGVRVRYQGRVVSGPVPSGGVLVVMQGRRERGTWQPFAYRKVRRGGKFNGTYRLRVHRPGVKLEFRAVVPRTTGYSYETGTSRTVRRRVR